MVGERVTGGYSVRDFKSALTRAVFDVHDRSGAFLDLSPDDPLFGCTADGLARDAEALAFLLKLAADAWRVSTAAGMFTVGSAVKPRARKAPKA